MFFVCINIRKFIFTFLSNKSEFCIQIWTLRFMLIILHRMYIPTAVIGRYEITEFHILQTVIECFKTRQYNGKSTMQCPR